MSDMRRILDCMNGIEPGSPAGRFDFMRSLNEAIKPDEGPGSYWYALEKDGHVCGVNENDDDMFKLWDDGWEVIWDSARSEEAALKFGQVRGLIPMGSTQGDHVVSPPPARREPTFVPDGRERYRDALAPGSRGQTIEITKPLRAYHATHEYAGKILTDRVAMTYDSIGTWLSSNREIAQRIYGPNVSAYEVPSGRYMLARRSQDLRELIMNCLPMIKRHVGKDVYKYVQQYPDDAESRAWLNSVRDKAKAFAQEYGDERPNAHNDYIYRVLQSMPTGSVKRYRELGRQHNVYRQIAVNADYSKAYKAWLIQCGYTGIIWNNRHWDTNEGRQTIFLILKHDDLHPIETFPKRK